MINSDIIPLQVLDLIAGVLVIISLFAVPRFRKCIKKSCVPAIQLRRNRIKLMEDDIAMERGLSCFRVFGGS